MKISQRQFITQFAESDEFESKASAERAFNHLKSILKEQLIAGNEVSFGQDFGSLVAVTRAARQGVNPSTGGKLDIPAKQAIKFKISAPLKLAINA